LFSFNTRKNELLNDILIAIFFFLLVVISKMNILSLPYYWDEFVYIRPTHWLYQGSLLRIIPGLHPSDMFYGHPPGLYLSLAVLYRIFGETISVSHGLVIIFSFVGVFFTYLLASHLHNRATGILAALLLFFSPLYFAQSGMVLGDIPITALGIMAVYFMLREQYTAYLLSGLYLVMVKESAMAIIAAIVLYLYLTERASPGIGVKILKYSVPLFAIGAFFVMQKVTTGIALPNPYFSSHTFIAAEHLGVWRGIYKVLTWTFYGQYRFILCSFILLNFLINRKKVWKKEYILFLLITVFFVGAFAFIYFLARYILPVLPFLCIAGAYSIASLFRNPKVQMGIGIVIMLLFIGHLDGPKTERGSFELDMQYVDAVFAHKAACEYLEENFPDKRVLASWQGSQELSDPHWGYIKKPVKVVSYGENYDVVLYDPQGSAANIKLKKIIEKRNMILIKRFTKNDKYIEIFGST
jgi:4-amino-4-deoxy-L-arabinose transferase-like glycosyltransferase